MNKGPLILLIDDDADDTQLFTETVSEIDAQLQCITMPDALKALSYLQSEGNPIPDFIFLDLRMPRMSGQKCLVEINKIQRIQHVPVFVYTTSRDEKDIENLTRGGAVMFIAKPADPQELYYLISSIIGEKWK